MKNFRSVASSGEIPVEDLTALVGRNESGKSNLLLALETVNPTGGQKDIDPVKNFPRGRHLKECRPDTVIAKTVWKLDPAQAQELLKVLPNHAPLTDVQVTRRYGATQRSVELLGLKPPALEPKKVASLLRRVMPVIEGVVTKIPEPHLEPARNALQAVNEAVARQDDPRVWGQAVTKRCTALRAAIGTGGVTLEETPDELLAELEEMAANLSTFEEGHGKAKELVIGAASDVYLYR